MPLSLRLSLRLLLLPCLAGLCLQLAHATKPQDSRLRGTDGEQQRAQAAKPTRTKRAPAAAQAGTAYAQRADAMRAADEIAASRGLDPAWVHHAIGQARRLPQVMRWVLPAASPAAKNWRLYRSRFVEPVRIQAGVAFWQAHRAELERAEQVYGVPAQIIVGILGVESIFGRDTGNIRVIDALATLAFDFPDAHPRAAQRRAFFRSELEQLLSLAHRAGTDPLSYLGSYAGAMGMPQFMPSSWSRHAIDFDGDGRIDLFHSAADAIGSVANYFQAFGWRSGMPTHYGVQFDKERLDLPSLLAPDILPSFSVAEFTARGAVLDAQGLRHEGPLALIELFNAGDAPSYVAGTENFYVITRYNWSSYYALAVIELGQAIAAARTP